jgi:hypothetical protein
MTTQSRHKADRAPPVARFRAFLKMRACVHDVHIGDEVVHSDADRPRSECCKLARKIL